MFRKLPAFVDKLWDSKWALKLATSGSIPVDPETARRDDGLDAFR